MADSEDDVTADPADVTAAPVNPPNVVAVADEEEETSLIHKLPRAIMVELFDYFGLMDRLNLSVINKSGTELTEKLPLCTKILSFSINEMGQGQFVIKLDKEVVKISDDYYAFREHRVAGKLKPLFNWGYRAGFEVTDVPGEPKTTHIICDLGYHAERVFQKMVDFIVKNVIATKKPTMKNTLLGGNHALFYLVKKIRHFSEVKLIQPIGMFSNVPPVLSIHADKLIMVGFRGRDFLEYNGPLNVGNLIAQHAGWLTKQSLLQMTSTFVWANDTFLPLSDINEVLLKWKDGGFSNLQKLSIGRWKLRVEGEDGPAPYEQKNLVGLKMTEWRIPMCLYEDNDGDRDGDENFMTCPTWCFRNVHGTLGAVRMTADTIKFFVAGWNPDLEWNFRYTDIAFDPDNTYHEWFVNEPPAEIT